MKSDRCPRCGKKFFRTWSEAQASRRHHRRNDMTYTDEQRMYAANAVALAVQEINLDEWDSEADSIIADAVLEAVQPTEPTLDELLDSLPPQTRIEHFPYYRMDDGKYRCKIVVPRHSRAISGVFAHHYGAGATRMEAIRAAVANAKGGDA